MHALITGGAGVIGAHVAEQMLASGDRVTTLDLSGATGALAALQQRYGGMMAHHAADITDLNALHGVLHGAKVDVVIHLASMLSAASDRDPGRATRVNLVGSANVFEAAQALGLPRVVCASSITVYGADSDYRTDELPLRESAALRVAAGARFYGAGKVYLEALAEAFAGVAGPFVVGLRPSIVYGGLQEPGSAGWLQAAASSAANGQDTVIENGDSSMSLVHILDVADQFVALARAPLAKFDGTPTFFNSGGDACTVSDVAGEIAAACPGVKVSVVAGSTGPVMGIATSLDGTAIEAIVGHPRRFPLKLGIARYVDDLRTDFEGSFPLA